MPTPTRTTRSQIVDDFWDLWNFPNCIGAIDGKHVKVQAPPNSDSKFFHYKQFFFSVVLLALVDARYTFTVVRRYRVVWKKQRWRDFCTFKTCEIFITSSRHSGR